MSEKNKFFERLGVASVVLLCAFSSWFFINQAIGGGPVDIGSGPGGGGVIGGDKDGGDVKGGGNAYYFTNTVNTDPNELGNYWYDAELSAQASEIPDFSSQEVYIQSDAQFDGDITMIGNSRNDGTINGNATFYGESSENFGTVTGTLSRVYTEATETSRDFTSNGEHWTITAANGAVVDVTQATYDQNTTFTRSDGGRFTSDMHIVSTSVLNNILTITYDRVLDEHSVPASQDFTINVNDSEVSPVDVSISDSSVILTLESDILADSNVSVNYHFGDTIILSSNGLDSPELINNEAVVQTPVKLRAGRYSGLTDVASLASPVSELKFIQPSAKEETKTEVKPKTLSANVDNGTKVEVKTETKVEEKVFAPRATVSEPAPVEPKAPVVENPLADKLKTKLLLAVEDKGKVWYVSPNENFRYEVTMNNAWNLFRKVSLGITNKDLDQIPTAGSSDAVTPLSKRLSGRFLLQVESRGESWYVDQAGYKYRVTDQNLLDVTKKSVLGITNEKLEQIPVGNIAQ